MHINDIVVFVPPIFAGLHWFKCPKLLLKLYDHVVQHREEVGIKVRQINEELNNEMVINASALQK